MKKKGKHKILKRITLALLGLILLGMLGLIADNRICAATYNKLSTDGDILTNDEIAAVKGVYEYLNNYGEGIFEGFKENTDLIIFNDSYEFLICDRSADPAWEFVDSSTLLNKTIYRRKADNPQAFAVSVNDKWVGSMSTKNTFNKTIVNTVPIFFPPQALIMDDEQYKAMVIHEMVHAYEGNHYNKRLLEIQKLHDICANYYDNNNFNELIIEEAKYLEQAILAQSQEDVLKYSRKFLETREKRRTECKMSTSEILNEMNFEWLEGLARYAEYKASAGSNSMVAKNLADIDQKVSIKADDRYYTLGMAQALVLDRLQKDWKKDMFTSTFSMEGYLKRICESD